MTGLCFTWCYDACLQLLKPLCVSELCRRSIEVGKPNKWQCAISADPGNGGRQLLILAMPSIPTKHEHIGAFEMYGSAR